MKYNQKKMIEAFRDYLEKTNSRCNPRFETYSINELLKVCFLYKIDTRQFEL